MNRLRSLLLITLCLSFALTGCETFRRKFVRKPKGKREIEVVVHTQEYTPEHSVAQTYKKYFLFWKAAHEDLLNSLSAQDGNRKKRIFAAKKIVEHLQQIRRLLQPEKQTRLDALILEQKNIVRQLDKYKMNRAQTLRIKSILGKQRRQIQKEFNYKFIQEYLIEEWF